jgi:hypothetical protein
MYYKPWSQFASSYAPITLCCYALQYGVCLALINGVKPET